MHKLLAALFCSLSLQACVMHGVSTMARPHVAGSPGFAAASPLAGGHVSAGPQGAAMGFRIATPNGPVGAHVAAGPNGFRMGGMGPGAAVETEAHAGPGGVQMGSTVATDRHGVQRVGLGVAAPVR